MFSGFTNYLWGSASTEAAAAADASSASGLEVPSSVPAPPPRTSSKVPASPSDAECEPMETMSLEDRCGTSVMDVMSVGSDEDVVTPPQLTSDDEWVVISEDEEPPTTAKSTKASSFARHAHQKGKSEILCFFLSNYLKFYILH